MPGCLRHFMHQRNQPHVLTLAADHRESRSDAIRTAMGTVHLSPVETRCSRARMRSVTHIGVDGTRKQFRTTSRLISMFAHRGGGAKGLWRTLLEQC